MWGAAPDGDADPGHRRGGPPRAAGGLRDRLLDRRGTSPGSSGGAPRDPEKTEWSIHVVDLVSDHFLAERWFETKRAEVAGVCEKFGPAIAILLDKSEIQAVNGQRFEQPSATDDPTGFDLRPGSPDAESGKIPYDVILRGAAAASASARSTASRSPRASRRSASRRSAACCATPSSAGSRCS